MCFRCKISWKWLLKSTIIHQHNNIVCAPVILHAFIDYIFVTLRGALLWWLGKNVVYRAMEIKIYTFLPIHPTIPFSPHIKANKRQKAAHDRWWRGRRERTVKSFSALKSSALWLEKPQQHYASRKIIASVICAINIFLIDFRFYSTCERSGTGGKSAETR